MERSHRLCTLVAAPVVQAEVSPLVQVIQEVAQAEGTADQHNREENVPETFYHLKLGGEGAEFLLPSSQQKLKRKRQIHGVSGRENKEVKQCKCYRGLLGCSGYHQVQGL